MYVTNEWLVFEFGYNIKIQPQYYKIYINNQNMGFTNKHT